VLPPLAPFVVLLLWSAALVSSCSQVRQRSLRWHTQGRQQEGIRYRIGEVLGGVVVDGRVEPLPVEDVFY
jgi:hypothetical protein